MRKKYVVLVLGLVAIAVIGGWRYSEWMKSPEYSLIQARNAYDRHDISRFERYVDVDAVVEKAIDSLSQVAFEVIATIDASPNGIGQKLASDYIDVMRPQTVENARMEFLSEVAGRSSSKRMGEQMFGNAATKVAKSYVRYEGEFAYFGIDNLGKGPADTIPLEFKLRSMGGYWRVEELSNLAAVIAQRLELNQGRMPIAEGTVRTLFDNLGSTGEWFHSEWTRSPEYSVLKLKTALETNDSALFERHCDIDSVLTRAVDVFIEVTMTEAIKSAKAEEEFAVAMAAVFFNLMKPSLVEYARQQLLMHVEGRPAGSDARAESKGGLEKGFDSVFERTQADLHRVSLQREGQAAFLSIETYSDEHQKWTTWELKLRDVGGYWQVNEISNLKAVLASE